MLLECRPIQCSVLDKIVEAVCQEELQQGQVGRAVAEDQFEAGSLLTAGAFSCDACKQLLICPLVVRNSLGRCILQLLYSRVNMQLVLDVLAVALRACKVHHAGCIVGKHGSDHVLGLFAAESSDPAHAMLFMNGRLVSPADRSRDARRRVIAATTYVCSAGRSMTHCSSHSRLPGAALSAAKTSPNGALSRPFSPTSKFMLA